MTEPRETYDEANVRLMRERLGTKPDNRSLGELLRDYLASQRRGNATGT